MKQNHFRMKYITFFFPLVIAIILVQCTSTQEHKNKSAFEKYNFIVANDLGRNGYYDQKPIAEQMGIFTDSIDIEFVAAVGDIHHFDGVASIQDPLWETNFEKVYSHPGLMLNWFPVLGNHEYRGNTQACLDYGKISRRWNMPARYYTKVMEVNDSTSLRLVFIDTTPLIDKYREEKETYPDACKQDQDEQLHFIDSVLSVSKETWTIVLGHHPVFAFTLKSENERIDMQKRINPLLEKYGVDFYFSGHIHNFQHIKKKNSNIDYIVNSSASRSRPVQKTDGTVFCSDLSGFSICSVDKHKFSVSFIDVNGDVIYSYAKEK
jgi:3',5'-cyclic AMP phosphodiesterase CpdA